METMLPIDPKIETTGDSILSVLASIKRDKVLPILKKHGLDTVEKGKWYPAQPWVQAMYEIANAKGGAFDLVSIGMKIPATAIFPPEIDSVEKAILGWDIAYQMNHRGGDIGKYIVTPITRGFRVEDRTPYPTDLSYGVLNGFIQRFRTDNVQYTIFHDSNSPSRKRGGESSTYMITW